MDAPDQALVRHKRTSVDRSARQVACQLFGNRTQTFPYCSSSTMACPGHGHYCWASTRKAMWGRVCSECGWQGPVQKATNRCQWCFTAHAGVWCRAWSFARRISFCCPFVCSRFFSALASNSSRRYAWLAEELSRPQLRPAERQQLRPADRLVAPNNDAGADPAAAKHSAPQPGRGAADRGADDGRDDLDGAGGVHGGRAATAQGDVGSARLARTYSDAARVGRFPAWHGDAWPWHERNRVPGNARHGVHGMRDNFVAGNYGMAWACMSMA